MDHYDSRRVTINGREFLARFYYDDTNGAPWDREDGHGPIRQARAPYGVKHQGIKRAGEVVIHSDRWDVWLYDVAEAQRIAVRDGWSFSPDRLPRFHWAKNLKPETMTARARAAVAVRLDAERMGEWLNSEWHYSGVSVTLVTDEDEDPEEEYSFALWGIESDAGDYWDEVIADLASEALAHEERNTYPVHNLGT